MESVDSIVERCKQKVNTGLDSFVLLELFVNKFSGRATPFSMFDIHFYFLIRPS